jgi:hypothetical protein
VRNSSPPSRSAVRAGMRRIRSCYCRRACRTVRGRKSRGSRDGEKEGRNLEGRVCFLAYWKKGGVQSRAQYANITSYSPSSDLLLSESPSPLLLLFVSLFPSPHSCSLSLTEGGTSSSPLQPQRLRFLVTHRLSLPVPDLTRGSRSESSSSQPLAGPRRASRQLIRRRAPPATR